MTTFGLRVVSCLIDNLIHSGDNRSRLIQLDCVRRSGDDEVFADCG
jgi:hypothetical protein